MEDKNQTSLDNYTNAQASSTQTPNKTLEQELPKEQPVLFHSNENTPESNEQEINQTSNVALTDEALKELNTLRKYGIISAICSIFWILCIVSLILDIIAIAKIINSKNLNLSSSEKTMWCVLFGLGWLGWIGLITSAIIATMISSHKHKLENNIL